MLATVQVRIICSHVVSNVKIKIYRIIILPLVSYGCETWYLTLWEEPGLRVFEDRMLRRIFGPTRDEVTGAGGNFVMRNFITFILCRILLEWPNQGG
jgi:hypothetical protein